MLLAVDMGNTNIKFAVFDGETIKVGFRMTTDPQRTSDEYGADICMLLANNSIPASSIDAVIISSVVPDVMHALNNAVIKLFHITPLVVGPGTKTGIRLVKTNPAEVGSDRIVDGVAALELYGGPVIVVDYGTATKFDYFSAEHVFESAVTCPGIKLAMRSLSSGTARLPQIEITDPGTIMCKDTITSLQAGLLYGRIGEAEYIIRRMKEESTEENIKVVATGGLAYAIYQKTDEIDYFNPDLTMIGLRILYEKNK